jgi:5-methylcytosine-specific restriction enzyme A
MSFKRKRLSTTERTAMYDAARGEKAYPVCPRCNMPVFPGDRWNAGHELSPELGGKNVADRVEHARCNHDFAANYEVPLIAKNKRVRARFIGAFRSQSPLPGGRDDVLKKTFSGLVVDRRTGQPFGRSSR